MSSDPVVHQVASLNDIVEVISAYIPIKKSGRNLKACCPFHPEKTPSFMVNPERQIFHCFGCGAGGDVFSFVMKIENLNFPEALRKLADRVHMVLPERGNQKKSAQERSRKEQLLDICHLAAQYFKKNFEDPNIGREARAYMAQRGFEPQILESYGVGYATDSWQGLFSFLSGKKFPQDLLFRSGIISQGREGRAFDLFRKRVIFPILDSQGRVIAFGGRALNQVDMPKYLNSPETEIFQKRNELYGLAQAKRYVDPDQSRFLVVEGYLDLIRLVQCGFKNTVATLGTSLTSDHCRLLRRYVMEAVLVYDGDRAGESASIRGIDVFLEEGMNIKLLSLPAGSDPDDYLRESGADAFKKLLENAQDVFDFKLGHLLKRFDPKDTLGLVRITNELLEMLLKVKHSVLVDRYLKRMSGFLGIDESSIRKEFLKLQLKTQERQESKTAEISAVPPAGAASAVSYTYEWTVLGLAAKEAKYLIQMLRRLEANDFRDTEAKRIFEFMCAVRSQENPVPLSINDLFARLESEEKRSLLARLAFFDLSEEDSDKAFEDCIGHMLDRNRKHLMAELLSKIKQAEATGQGHQVSDYMKQYQELVAGKNRKITSRENS
ncbi:MAG: DNA primase [Candidatus Omnitrophica bacterium]|nr:DNA primase [Candidatus Omnitrophota bacterium]